MRNRVFYIISEFLGYKTQGGFAGLQVKHIFNFTTHYQKYSLKKKEQFILCQHFSGICCQFDEKEWHLLFSTAFP